MKRRFRMVVPMMFLALAATVWAAEVTWDSEFGNTLYNTPKGWSTTQKSGSILLIPPDLAPGEQAAIVITPGGELTGEFKDALTQFRALLRGNVKATESKTESLTADEGYPILHVAEQLKNEKGETTQYRYFFASHPGSRAEFVVLIATTEGAYDRYNAAFGEFVKTLAYKNARPGAHSTSVPSTQTGQN